MVEAGKAGTKRTHEEMMIDNPHPSEVKPVIAKK
jgi:hypothetical protein